MFTEYQQQLRERFLAAPVTPAPPPWRPVFHPGPATPIGDLLGIGFGLDPATRHDLVMVVSQGGHGVLDAETGAVLARDRAPDPDVCEPAGPYLSCPGLGPLAGAQVRIAGLHGGGLHSMTEDGWTVDVVSPDWPRHRVLLSTDGGLCHGPAGGVWWHIHHTLHNDLRAAGFSPTGRTLAIATSSDLTILTRAEAGAGAGAEAAWIQGLRELQELRDLQESLRDL